MPGKCEEFLNNNNNNNNNNKINNKNNNNNKEIEKCAKATFIRGKLVRSTDIHVDTEAKIGELDQEET